MMRIALTDGCARGIQECSGLRGKGMRGRMPLPDLTGFPLPLRLPPPPPRWRVPWFSRQFPLTAGRMVQGEAFAWSRSQWWTRDRTHAGVSQKGRKAVVRASSGASRASWRRLQVTSCTRSHRPSVRQRPAWSPARQLGQVLQGVLATGGPQHHLQAFPFPRVGDGAQALLKLDGRPIVQSQFRAFSSHAQPSSLLPSSAAHVHRLSRRIGIRRSRQPHASFRCFSLTAPEAHRATNRKCPDQRAYLG